MIMRDTTPASLSTGGRLVIAIVAAALLPWAPALVQGQDRGAGPASHRDQSASRDSAPGRDSENADMLSRLLSRIGQLLVDGHVEEARELAAEVRQMKRSRGGVDRSIPRDRRDERLRGERVGDIDVDIDIDDRDRGDRADEDHEGRGDEDQVRHELEVELHEGLHRLEEELHEAAEEVRVEILGAIHDAPEHARQVLREIDVDAVLDEAVESVPDSVRRFVKGLRLEELIDQALEEANHNLEIPELQAEEFEELRAETEKELREAVGELSREAQDAVKEVREEIAETVDEVSEAIDGADIARLIEQGLAHAPEATQEFLRELDIPAVVDRALRESRRAAARGAERVERNRVERSERRERTRRRGRQRGEETEVEREKESPIDRNIRSESEDLSQRVSRLESLIGQLLEELESVKDELQEGR